MSGGNCEGSISCVYLPSLYFKSYIFISQFLLCVLGVGVRAVHLYLLIAVVSISDTSCLLFGRKMTWFIYILLHTLSTVSIFCFAFFNIHVLFYKLKKNLF